MLLYYLLILIVDHSEPFINEKLDKALAKEPSDNNVGHAVSSPMSSPVADTVLVNVPSPNSQFSTYYIALKHTFLGITEYSIAEYCLFHISLIFRIHLLIF